MSVRSELERTIKITGLSPLAKKLGVTYQSIRGWQDRNRMPDTEYSGRTSYAVTIEEMTDGKVTVEKLLGHRPACLDL